MGEKFSPPMNFLHTPMNFLHTPMNFLHTLGSFLTHVNPSLSIMQLDVGNLPIIFAEMFGTSVFAGGIFCTLLVWLASAIPLFWVIKDKGAPYTIVVHSLLILGFATAIGWVDVWLILLVALGEASVLALLTSERT